MKRETKLTFENYDLEVIIRCADDSLPTQRLIVEKCQELDSTATPDVVEAFAEIEEPGVIPIRSADPVIVVSPEDPLWYTDKAVKFDDWREYLDLIEDIGGSPLAKAVVRDPFVNKLRDANSPCWYAYNHRVRLNALRTLKPMLASKYALTIATPADKLSSEEMTRIFNLTLQALEAMSTQSRTIRELTEELHTMTAVWCSQIGLDYDQQVKPYLRRNS